MKKIKLFKDILKTKTKNGYLKYSQGRVYLFAFILTYIGALAYFVIKPNDYMQTIVDALQWAILLFAAYVFGGKGIDAFSPSKKEEKYKDETNVPKQN